MRARGLPAPRWSNSSPSCLHSTAWVVSSVPPSPHSLVSLYCVHDIILFSNYHRDDANNSPCYHTSDQSVKLSMKGNTLLSPERGAQRQGEARESGTRWLVFSRLLSTAHVTFLETMNEEKTHICPEIFN